VCAHAVECYCLGHYDALMLLFCCSLCFLIQFGFTQLFFDIIPEFKGSVPPDIIQGKCNTACCFTRHTSESTLQDTAIMLLSRKSTALLHSPIVRSIGKRTMIVCEFVDGRTLSSSYGISTTTTLPMPCTTSFNRKPRTSHATKPTLSFVSRLTKRCSRQH